MNKRPILIITISYMIGILLGLYLEINIVLFGLTSIIITLLFIFWCNNHRPKCSNGIDNKYYDNVNMKKHIKEIIISISIVLISFTIMHYRENRFKVLYENVSDNIEYIGTVIKVEKESQYYYNYIMKVKNIENNSKLKNTCILLKIKKSKNSKSYELKYGDLISGTGNLEQPEVARNYKGYDYSKYLKTKNVYMICNSNIKDVKIIRRDASFVINMWISQLRTKLEYNLLEILPKESANIAIALLLGDSRLISDDQKQEFSNASLSHILAISGMHVTFIIMILHFLLKKFDKRNSKYLLICFLIFFSQLTGATPSIIRAVIMSSIMILAKLVYRKSDTINNISLACLIILVVNPYNILNLGFQLSFLGTLGIVLFNSKLTVMFEKYTIVRKDFIGVQYDIKPQNGMKQQDGMRQQADIKQQNNMKLKYCIEQRHNSNSKFSMLIEKLKFMINKIIQKLKLIIILSISANILIFPILVYTYNTVSLTFLISNILVTPIVGIMCAIGYITIIASTISMKIAKIFSVYLNICIRIFNMIAVFCSNAPFTRFTVITPSMITIIVYYLVIIYIFYFYKKSHKKLIFKILALVMIIVIILNLGIFQNSELRLYFVDVGQGDCTLIVTATGKKILIDGGGSESGGYDVGENVLVPYLLDRKIMTIDYVIFSHFDSDHCKGLFTVMENLKVKNTVISNQGEISENYKYFLELSKNKSINVMYVQAGDRLKIDKFTYIDILWPDKDLIHENVLNNNSIVCKVNYKNVSILFTGDIEEIAERKILSKYGSNQVDFEDSKGVLKADILKVAHHGSKSSSIQEFLNKVQPKVALIGVGKNNNFGHPNEKVIERLENLRC